MIRVLVAAACVLIAGCGATAPPVTEPAARPVDGEPTGPGPGGRTGPDVTEPAPPIPGPPVAGPDAGAGPGAAAPANQRTDCVSGALGMGVTTPAGWECRELDRATAGIDGVALLAPGTELSVVVGTTSPLGPPCQPLGICDGAAPVDLSGKFPTTASVTFAGAVSIWGRHRDLDVEVTVTKPTALTGEEMALVAAVLDSAEVAGPGARPPGGL